MSCIDMKTKEREKYLSINFVCDKECIYVTWYSILEDHDLTMK